MLMSEARNSSIEQTEGADGSSAGARHRPTSQRFRFVSTAEIADQRRLEASVQRELSEVREEVLHLRPLAHLGQMAATVAHEVRNPLAGISANAELLAEAPALDPEDKETIDIILGEVHRLSQLVTDLLTYAREREPRCEVVDLTSLAKHACELSRPEAEKYGIELRVKGRGRAFADSDLSRQALLNVLRNAIQASPEAGVVHVLVDEARLSIMDQGGGVPQQLRANLFEPFVAGRTRGMGLGAAVALRCQQRQGGYLALVATGPSGSTFEFGWQTCPEW